MINKNSVRAHGVHATYHNTKNGSSGGSGSGSVGRAVASNIRGPRFKSSHRQNFKSNICLLLTVNCYEKTKINEKEAGNGPFFLKKMVASE